MHKEQKVTNNNDFKIIPITKHPQFKKLVLTAVLMTIYGSLFLMVGYTQILVAKTLFAGNHDNDKYMPLMLVPQMIGLYFGSILYGFFIKKFNLRWVYMMFFTITSVSVLIIAFLDQYGSNEVALIFIYIIFSFLFGIGIGPVNPLISMFIGDVFTGERRVRLLGIINAFYGLGAGLFPLVFSSLILNLSHGASYEGARIFYLIAFVLAIIGVGVGFFIKYKFSVDKPNVHNLSIKTKQKLSTGNDYKKPFWFCFLLMTMLFVIATALIFNFTQFILAARTNSHTAWQIVAIQAFGVYAVIQSVWRTASGLWISKKMSAPSFLFLSLFITLIAVVIIFAGALKYEAGVFIVAILLGLGLGNVYPVLFNYALELNINHKIYLSRQMGIGQGLGVVLGQISIGAFWLLHQKMHATTIQQDAVLIFNVLFIILTIGALYFTTRSVNKFRHVEQMSFKKLQTFFRRNQKQKVDNIK